MNVRDLIKQLEQVDPNLTVMVSWEDDRVQYGVSRYSEARSLKIGRVVSTESRFGPLGNLVGENDPNVVIFTANE